MSSNTLFHNLSTRCVSSLWFIHLPPHSAYKGEGCLCIVVERMINGRRVWYLEKNKLITNMQSGFRKQRNTTDKWQSCADWKLHTWGICSETARSGHPFWSAKGRRYNVETRNHKRSLWRRATWTMFILGFIQNRRFQVRLGSHMSNVFKQEMGVPQGSILCHSFCT